MDGDRQHALREILQMGSGTVIDAASLTLLVVAPRDLRQVLVEVLSDAGYPVSAASNVHRALALMARDLPAMVILDWPIQDGPELLSVRSGAGHLACIPLLVLYAPEGGAAPLVDALLVGGSTLHLRKPFDLEALLRMVSEHARPR